MMEKCYCKCGKSFDNITELNDHWDDPGKIPGSHYRATADGSDYFIASNVRFKSYRNYHEFKHPIPKIDIDKKIPEDYILAEPTRKFDTPEDNGDEQDSMS